MLWKLTTVLSEYCVSAAVLLIGTDTHTYTESNLFLHINILLISRGFGQQGLYYGDSRPEHTREKEVQVQ